MALVCLTALRHLVSALWMFSLFKYRAVCRYQMTVQTLPLLAVRRSAGGDRGKNAELLTTERL